MDSRKMYTVKNRSASVVVINIPDLGIRREFAPGESTRMSFAELQKLSFQAGGRELMANFLQIMDDDVNDELNVPREPEYYMSEEQIVEMLQSGSLAQFEDCLDFAPIGVIDLVKQISVQLPLTDTIKINALHEKTGFDVIKALDNQRADSEPEEVEEPKKAEQQKSATSTTPTRRTNTNYKVTSRKSE